jgi:hypothetical protein
LKSISACTKNCLNFMVLSPKKLYLMRQSIYKVKPTELRFCRLWNFA